MNIDRHFSLDALRGFAVMGILLMNIVSFAMPDAAYINPMAWGGDGVADIAAWAISWVLFDGKMRGLFSLLFGASMLLVIDRAEMAGGTGRRVHLARAFWLFLFGAAHFLLLWWGDILMLYAVVSLAALPFVHREPIALVKWAFAAFGLHLLIVGALLFASYGVQHAAARPDATAATMRGFADMTAAYGRPGTQAIVDTLAVYRSGLPVIVAHEWAMFGTNLFNSVLYLGFDTLGFMLLGMAMLKSGFLTGAWPVDQYRRTARHCFLIGLPPMVALAIWVMLSGFDALTTFGAFLAWSFPFRVPLTVGYAALLLWLIRSAPGHWLIVRIAATGRAAFSNYLGTSLLMCAIFYGWGLGLFGAIDRAPLYLFVLLAWALMLLWSKPWLDRFVYGPMEWLWRSLARGRLQSMRKSVPA